MKKLLAVLMTLVMLLGVCAAAETAAVEASGAEIKLGDFIIYENDAALLDLSGLGLEVGAYMGAENSGLQLAINAADKQALALNIGVAGEQLLLGMTGISNVYSLDASALVADIGLDAMVEELNLDEIAQQIDPEDQMTMMALGMEAVALIEAGITPAGTEEIDGATYEVTKINVAAEDLKPIVDKMVEVADKYSDKVELEGFESISELYASLNPSLGLDGKLYAGEADAIVDFTFNAGAMDASGYLNVYAKIAMGEGEAIDLFAKFTVGSGESSYALSFNLDVIASNDGSWIPAADAPVDLLAALEDEGQSQQLLMEAMGALMSTMGQVAAANETVAALIGSMM